MELESDSHILSKEETFHLRISHLLLRYGTTAIRVYFDQEFDPSRLGKELLKNRKLLSELKLSAEQFEKLFPKGNLYIFYFDKSLFVMLKLRKREIMVTKSEI